jgi:hypothetical protein
VGPPIILLKAELELMVMSKKLTVEDENPLTCIGVEVE